MRLGEKEGRTGKAGGEGKEKGGYQGEANHAAPPHLFMQAKPQPLP